MLYRVENAALQETDLKNLQPGGEHQYLGFFLQNENHQVLRQFAGEALSLEEAETSGSMQFFNYEGYDLMCVHIPKPEAGFAYDKVIIYIGKNTLLFVARQEELLQKIKALFAGKEGSVPVFERILCTFFEKLSIYSVEFFDSLEQEISELEDALIESQKREFVKEIVALRRRLMALKRHYEQLLDLLDELQENENEVLNETTLSYFRIFSIKADRHYHNILNLRDYVTQVREAYRP
jgi:magnesium transporter